MNYCVHDYFRSWMNTWEAFQSIMISRKSVGQNRLLLFSWIPAGSDIYLLDHHLNESPTMHMEHEWGKADFILHIIFKSNYLQSWTILAFVKGNSFNLEYCALMYFQQWIIPNLTVLHINTPVIYKYYYQLMTYENRLQ